MKDILFRNWNFVRILRLIMGVAIIVMGIQQQQTMMAVLGGLFSLLAIFNAGCTAQGCNYPPSQKRKF